MNIYLINFHRTTKTQKKFHVALPKKYHPAGAEHSLNSFSSCAIVHASLLSSLHCQIAIPAPGLLKPATQRNKLFPL